MIGATSNPATNVYVTAFKDPANSRFALVAINNTDEPVTVPTRFDGFLLRVAEPWVTDARFRSGRTTARRWSGTGFPLTLGAKSVTPLSAGWRGWDEISLQGIIRAGAVWLDTSGEPIRAHDGGSIMKTAFTIGFGEINAKGFGRAHPRDRLLFQPRSLFLEK